MLYVPLFVILVLFVLTFILVLFPLFYRINGVKFRDISAWELQILTGVTMAAISHNYNLKGELDRISAKRGSQN